jgi:hypothetical protein
LSFTNALPQDCNVFTRIKGNPFTWNGARGTLFSLRANPTWALGGKAHSITIHCPDPSKVIAAEFVSTAQIMPRLSFPNSGYLGTKGFLHFPKDQPTVKLICASDKIAGATSFSLEIMRPNAFLSGDDLNTTRTSPLVWREISNRTTTTGEMALHRDLFQTQGIFQARLWALDAEGRRIGVAGDHINITID